jgi:DNA invertase Pin-like site-specific DNA recombinase
MGWKTPVVITDDLSTTATGFAQRPGFQSMMAQVVERTIGIIFCVDCSRLSRNSPDWATLFERCGHFDTLVADLDQIYDLTVPNDRMLIGIKATIAEEEARTIRRRLTEAAQEKAERGELKFLLPVGYVHEPDGSIVLDPDLRVQQAIMTAFEQFDRCGSVRQLALWYCDSKTLFPVQQFQRPSVVQWKVPSEGTLRNLIKHPIYTGTYTHGRRQRVIDYVDGQLVKRTTGCLPIEQWRVCIRDHHPAYISWERYHDNLNTIEHNRAGWAMTEHHGPTREGRALLSGLLRCGHCGKKINVSYGSTRQNALYYCNGRGDSESKRKCLSFGAKGVDQAVSAQLCEALSPLGVEAAQVALEHKNQQRSQAMKQAELRLQQAQYKADLAFDQFDAVDPKNRLVAANLESRLNDRLVEVQAATEQLEQIGAAEEMTEAQRAQITQLCEDFPSLWHHPGADPVIKKRLLRTALREIIVTHKPDQQRLELVLHWQGGCHTQLQVTKRATPKGSKTDPSLIELVRQLAELTDAEIARVLNMKQILTPKGLKWTKQRVEGFRRRHRIELRRRADPEQFMTAKQVCAELGISHRALDALVRVGALTKEQVTDFAPWRIARAEVESARVKELVRQIKETGRLPTAGECPPNQLTLTV